jgi:carboxyl-terminal processing protease
MCRNNLKIIRSSFIVAIGITLLFLSLIIFPATCLFAQENIDPKEKETYQAYLDSFEEIYKMMMENYYYEVDRKNFDAFLQKFNQEIFSKIDDKKNVNKFAMMRSGAFLVDFLKTKEDRFSALFPPEAAKEFEQEVLGVRIDLGIEGNLCEEGYCVTFVESRAEAFEKGLRPADILTKIDNVSLKKMALEKIQKLLTPEINTVTKLEYQRPQVDGKKTIEVTSKEYFKETVFPIVIPYPGIYGLEIRRFNRMTAEDLSKYLFLINQQRGLGLILDLRGNPGGPPLAAREIVSFFLEPEKNFAYFQRKGDERNYLDVPRIPEEYRYKDPVIILVNEESGSASELFSGVMQKENRALLMGTNTAGQVFLKSMFNLKDGAMLLLVTARGHFTNGEVFDFNGLAPQYRMDNKGTDLVYFAAGYLLGTAIK